MAHRARVSLLTAILAATLAATAHAQDDEDPVGPGRAIALGIHGGGVRFDGGGSRLSYGGRVILRLRNGIGIGGTATLAERSYDDDLTGGESEKADATFYTADISYMLKSSEPANLYGFIGAGVARFDPPPAHRALGVGEATEVAIPVGIGILWYAHRGAPWWALRTELRDNIVFLQDNSILGTDDAIANDWEISVGLSLLFGAYN